MAGAGAKIRRMNVIRTDIPPAPSVAPRFSLGHDRIHSYIKRFFTAIYLRNQSQSSQRFLKNLENPLQKSDDMPE